MGRKTTAVLLATALQLLLTSEQAVSLDVIHVRCDGVNGSFILQATKLTLQPAGLELVPESEITAYCEANANNSAHASTLLIAKESNESFKWELNFVWGRPTAKGPRWGCDKMSFDQTYPEQIEFEPKPPSWSFYTRGYKCSSVRIPLNSNASLEVENLRVMPYVEDGYTLMRKGELGEGWGGGVLKFFIFSFLN